MERDHMEDPDIDGRIILKCILEVGWKGGLARSGSIGEGGGHL